MRHIAGAGGSSVAEPEYSLWGFRFSPSTGKTKSQKPKQLLLIGTYIPNNRKIIELMEVKVFELTLGFTKQAYFHRWETQAHVFLSMTQWLSPSIYEHPGFAFTPASPPIAFSHLASQRDTSTACDITSTLKARRRREVGRRGSLSPLWRNQKSLRKFPFKFPDQNITSSLLLGAKEPERVDIIWSSSTRVGISKQGNMKKWNWLVS